MESVRYFAIRFGRIFRQVLEDVDAAAGGNLVRELRLAPTDVHRRGHVEEQIGRDTARVIPILAETEETVGAIVSCPVALYAFKRRSDILSLIIWMNPGNV